MSVTPMSESGDPRRWVVLTLFCLYSASNAIQWITYSSIATATRTFFGLTTNQLNMLSSVYMIVFVAGAYLTCTAFERFGVRRSVLVGCVLNALGSILKVAPGLQRPGYAVLIVSQTLNSIAQLFVLSTPPLIAAQYFSVRQRTFATTIAATANSLGNAIALLVPPQIVKSNTGTTNEFMLLFCLEMGLSLLVTVGVIFFLHPPSFKAPSQQLLQELGSVQSSVLGNQPRSSRTQQTRLRRGEREEESEESDDELCNGGDSNGHASSGDSDAYEQGDKQIYVERQSNAPTGHRRTIPTEPKASRAAARTDACASKIGTSRSPTAFTGLKSAVKPAGEELMLPKDSEDKTATSLPEMDRGSVSKHKRMTARQRLLHNKHVITFLETGHTIHQLFRRRDFIFLLGAFSISMGSVWTYASVLAQILEPFGVPNNLVGTIGAANIVVGTAAAYMVGLWVDRTRQYKYPLLACFVGAVSCCIGLIVIMLKVQSHSRMMSGLCSFIYVVAGIFQNTAIPICFEYAMEISYPLPESVPGTLLMAGANLCSLIMLSVASAMLGDGVASTSSCLHVLILITSVSALGVFFSLFPRERLRRRDAEEVQNRLIGGPEQNFSVDFSEATAS